MRVQRLFQHPLVILFFWSLLSQILLHPSSPSATLTLLFYFISCSLFISLGYYVLCQVFCLVPPPPPPSPTQVPVQQQQQQPQPVPSESIPPAPTKPLPPPPTLTTTPASPVPTTDISTLPSRGPETDLAKPKHGSKITRRRGSSASTTTSPAVPVTASSSFEDHPTTPPRADGVGTTASAAKPEASSAIAASGGSRRSAAERKPYPPPIPIPLKMTDCGTANVSPIQINSREPVEFENDYFKGRILVKIRTNPLDPFYAPYFEHRRRTFEFQLQGVFKQQPRGELMMGGEVGGQVHLGLMTRGLARLMLQVLRKLSPGIHYSFGDLSDSAVNASTTSPPPSDPNAPTKGEVPHVVFPFLKMMDRFIATPVGETPPKLGVDMLPETKDKETRGNLQADGTVYSMSFHSMYIDLVGWKSVNLSGIKDIDLRNFFGDYPIYIVGYDLSPPQGGKEESRHLQQQKRYFFRLKLENLGDVLHMDEEEPEPSPRPSSIEESVEPPTNMRSDETVTPTSSAPPSPRDTGLFSRMARTSSQPLLDGHHRQSSPRDSESTPILPTSDSSETVTSAPFVTPDLISSIRVPCCIELAGSRAKYTPAFLVEVSYTTPPDKEGQTSLKRKSLLVMWEEAAALYQSLSSENRSVVGPPPTVSSMSSSSSGSSALSSSQAIECKRKWLQESLQNETPALRVAVTRWLVELARNNPEEIFQKNSMWRQASENKHKKKHRHRSVTLELAVGRARWETQWREEFLVLSDDLSLRFYKYGSKHHEIKINLGSTFIRCTAIEREEQLPFADYHFLEVETVHRTIYLMFRSAATRDTVFRTFNHLFLAPASTAPTSLLESAMADLRESAFFKSELTDKTVLNAKQMCFRTVKFSWELSACDLITSLLENVLTLNSDSSITDITAFTDTTSKLKFVDPSTLTTREQKLAFWINCYHCLMVHALIILGAPNSLSQKATFFTDVCYQIGSSFYTLAEIEHAILRSGMTQPKVMFNFTLPKIKDGDLKYQSALKVSEPRLNFVLNCGTISCLSSIPVFKPENIDRQLDQASVEYLKAKVHILGTSGSSSHVSIPLQASASGSALSSILRDSGQLQTAPIYTSNSTPSLPLQNASTTPPSTQSSSPVLPPASESNSYINLNARHKSVVTLPKICKWYSGDFGGPNECLQCILNLLRLNIRPESCKVQFEKFKWVFHPSFSKLHLSS